jgi:hypothetical protein
MVSKNIAWLISAVTVAVAVHTQPALASAQVGRIFDIEYKTLTQISPLESQPDNFVRATITGTSTSPGAFGLDSFVSNTYGRLEPTGDPSLIKYSFNSNPTALGLPSNLEAFSDKYFGGENELFGKASDSAEINLAAGTIQGGGTITITGGKGVFENATGQITFSQQDRLGPPDVPAEGTAKLKFQIIVPAPRQVPEYTPATTTFIVTGLMGAVFLKRKRAKHKLALASKI